MRFLTAVAGLSLLASTAAAQTFGGYQMQLNGSGGNGTPQVNGSTLQLINDAYGTATSAFTTGTFNFTPATAFSTSFRLHYAWTSDVNTFGAGGDGIAFVMQGGPATALGGSGGDMGYNNGITNSLGVSFRSFWDDVWVGYGSNAFQVPVIQGSTGLVIGPNFDFTVDVNLAYDGANDLSVGYATSNGVLFAPHSYVVDPSSLGNSVRLGFTGASGSASQLAEVDNWTVSGLTQTTTTPEPATFGLFGLGAGCIAAVARRRRA